MHKSLIPLTTLSALYMSGCAHPSQDLPASPVQETDVLRAAVPEPINSQQKGRPDLSARNLTPSQPSQVLMIEASKDYWVKRVGTLVYNGKREPVRSLRFQPKVNIHKKVDGWGLIDAALDEWVKMSDLTLSQPADILAQPENSTGLPRVTVEDIMKPNNK